MNRKPMTPFLKAVLLVDAATCILSGILLLTSSAALERLLEIPAGLSLAAGLLLLAFGAAVAWVGTRRELRHFAVWVIISVNALWAVESLLALALGWLEPNAVGRYLVIAQAIAVAVIAELQFFGLRKASTQENERHAGF